MPCPSCAHANRPGAKFCEECAAPLKRACASCGCELRPTAKFCDECGAPASGAAPTPRPADPAGARKVMSIVFADLVGSTALHERLDPESARRFMESYYDAMRGAVESHGGTVTQLLGDGVKAVFGIPRVAEDDAIRAVRAAVAMQESFRALAEQQRGAVGKTGLRVAVNTGEVVANDEAEIIGDPVNVAARLQEQGRDGDVVIGDSTARLVSALVTLAPLGSFTLKGRAEAVSAFRVESLERPESAAIAAFVGRDAEIARITTVYDTAVEKPATCLAVLLGSPGLGKSRMIDEFARRLGEAATVVAAQCDAAGGATFAPLAEALRKRLGIDAAASGDAIRAAIEALLPGDDAERARIAGGIAALLAGSPAPPEETFFVVRRLLAALAKAKPVVLVIDDIHWAEPLLLDLVEHLVQWGSGVPLLVLCGARPELRDMRSSLVTPGGLVADVVTLAGLDAGAAMRLAANVIGAADLPAAVAAKVLATSEGNPLFVGELVRMLVHEGALTREGDRWTTGTALAALEMPPTIHALLAARIERLRPEERSVLERAAVVGRHFSRSAVAELLPRDVADLDARLESLRRSELIESDTGWFLGEPVLRFHHVLIRDAAYRRLLKGTRADLHERFADWAFAKAGDAIEHDETIGWHLEQAHQLLRELGPIDAKGRALGERASTHLAAAGRRALARDDLPLAASLLGRALERLDPDDPARADLALDWCEALLAAGDVGPAAAAIDELARFSAGSDRLQAWHICFAGQHTVLTAPSALHATADAVAAAADSLAALGDAAGEAKGHFVHALALSRLGEVGACEAALDRALAAARRAGDRRRANTVLAIAPLAALWGPSPVTRASGRCLDVVRVLRITQGAPAVESVALSCQGVLEALRGRTDAARRMIASARKMVEELGITQRLLEADVFGGLVLLLEGDAPGAERSLRGAYEGLRELGLGIDAARAAALFARALLAQDRVAEAEALSHESEALAGDDLKAAIAWRGVRAEALARRGEHAAAVEFASKAVELAAATDALLDHADARLALAAALRAAGRGREADAEEGRATELWEAKGATLLAERTAHAAAPVAPSVAAAAPRANHVPRRRPVRPNFAFEEMRRAEAAVATRDARALEALYRREIEIVDHQFGITYEYAAIVERVRAIIEDSTDSAFAHEPLASLGDSLALCRMRSTASGSTAHGIPVGATEVPYLLVIEADEQGSARHIEIFGDDKLADAVARLYERYAELLPEGPERARAAATARALGTMFWASTDLHRLAPILTADFESVDHRPLRTWSLRGSAAFIENIRALHEVAADVVIGVGDVLALEPSVMLVRRMHAGTERVGGGAYERPFLLLLAAGADGRIARAEWFDTDREAEALARFEALVAPAMRRRRARPNAATEQVLRLDAAMRASDEGAVRALFTDDLVFEQHFNAAAQGQRETVDGLVGLLADRRDLSFRHESLATLGDALSLTRIHIYSDGGAPIAELPFGAFEVEWPTLIEATPDARASRIEQFDERHLGDAVARLYQRYAEGLPEGAARARAEATARSVAVVAPGGFDRDRYAAAFRPDVAIVNHKLLGLGSGVGLEMLLRSMAAAGDVADQVLSHPQDVLALTRDALLLRWLASGVGRESGGAFEWAFLRLFVFDQVGRVAHYELFDDDREADALARFDALVGSDTEVPEEPFANAASRQVARVMHPLWDARDWNGLVALISPAMRMDDRRRILRLEIGYDEFLAQFRMLFDQPGSRWRDQLVATRGERLALTRNSFEAEVADGGGPLTFDEHLGLCEMDAEGRLTAFLTFDLEDEDAAYAELDARFAADAGAAHGRTTVAFDRAIARRDWDSVAALCSPAFVEHDHRSLAVLGTTHGADAWMHNFRALVELAPDTIYRTLHARGAARGFLSVGTWQGSREGGPYEIPLLAVCEVDARGAIARADLYDPGQQDQAFARFRELETTMSSRFANAASRADLELFDCFHARDWPGIEALAAPGLVFDERRRLVRNTCGRDVWLEQFRVLFDVPASHFTTKLLATRGERLSLNLHCFEGEVAGGGGPLAMDDHLVVHEVDADGRIVAIVLFDLEDVDAAYAELDARWQAGEGAAHPLAAKWLTDYLRCFATRDWDAMRALFAEGLVGHNHRLVGWGTLHGPAALVSTLEAQVALAPDTQERVDHVRTCARGVLFEYAWHGTHEGGAFENVWLVLVELDPAGRARRADVWEAEQQVDALARFDALQAAAGSTVRFANAATATSAPVIAALVAHDWARFEAQFAESFRCLDRRRMVQLELDRAGYVAFTREVADGRAIRGESVALATRGERLALVRSTFVFTDADVGPSEIPFLLVTEVSERGRIVAYVRFDDDDLDAAYAELDARWQAGEGADPTPQMAFLRSFDAALARRDWDAVAANHAPAFVGTDHRLVGWGTLRGPAAFVEAFRTLVALAPDVRLRWDHLRTSSRGLLAEAVWLGTRDGGAFENPFLLVAEGGADGRLLRADFYDVHHIDRAHARFEEIESAAPPHASRFANAATRSLEESAAVWMAANWERFASLFSADAHLSDRRRAVQLELGRDELIAFSRALGEHATTRIIHVETLATRGERLALQRWRIELAGDGVGPSEISHLTLMERDERGIGKGAVRWDEDEIEAAYAELDARFEAGEGAAHPHALASDVATNAAIRSRDWDALAALCAPTFRMRDHRLLGWGTLVNDAATFVRVIRSASDVASDARYRDDHLRICARGTLCATTLCGTRDGGAFENPFLRVNEVDEQGQVLSSYLYDESDYERAFARFAELEAPAAPAGRFENAASRAWRAVNEAWTARDLERFAAPHAAALRYRDHRHLFELDLDRAGFLDFTRPLLTMRAGDASLDLVATRGEQLALMHSVMEMEDESVGPSVIESLMLIETDERGDIAAYDRWDLADEDAAWAELDARFDAGEALERALAAAWCSEFQRAFASRDWDAMNALQAPDQEAHDHRLVGWGTLRGAGAWTQTLQELVTLAPDVRQRVQDLRLCARGSLWRHDWYGTRDGGAFVSSLVLVVELDGRGRQRRLDVWDADRQGAAFARFEEIRANERRDPLAAIAKPNAANATMDRWEASYDVAFETGDWEPMRALCAPDLVFDDRRRLALLSGDRDFMIASARERVAMGARPQRRLLGTAGDRVVIETLLWSGGPPDGRFEIEYLGVIEVDESGLLTGMVMFDSDDTRAAQREAWARWAAIDPAVAAHLALLSSAADAFNERDRARVRAHYVDDVVVEDHRRAGLGRIEGGDAYADSLAVLWELTSVATVELGWYWPAIAREGALVTIRRTGDVAGGGPFESGYLYLFLHAHGRITHIELFELEDLDAALAHFDELHAREPHEGFATGVAPNLATAAMQRNWATFDVLDLDAAQAALDTVRAEYAPDFVWDDRRPLVGLSGDLDLMLASVRERLAMGARQQRTILATAGDRVAIGRALWAGGPEDGRFEVEFLVVSEVDAAGLFTALVFFEPDDTRAAQREAWARWAAIDPAVAPCVKLLNEITDAWNAHDRARLRARMGRTTSSSRTTGTPASAGSRDLPPT